jgi:hypothetical protein
MDQPWRKGVNIPMMKQIVVVALTLGLSLTRGAAMAQEGFKVVDTISSTSLKLIQTALPELARHGLNMDGYRITVTTWNGRPAVDFVDLNAPPGQKGTAPNNKPSFEVELSEDGTRVVRSNFVR